MCLPIYKCFISFLSCKWLSSPSVLVPTETLRNSILILAPFCSQIASGLFYLETLIWDSASCWHGCITPFMLSTSCSATTSQSFVAELRDDEESCELTVSDDFCIFVPLGDAALVFRISHRCACDWCPLALWWLGWASATLLSSIGCDVLCYSWLFDWLVIRPPIFFRVVAARAYQSCKKCGALWAGCRANTWTQRTIHARIPMLVFGL